MHSGRSIAMLFAVGAICSRVMPCSVQRCSAPAPGQRSLTTAAELQPPPSSSRAPELPPKRGRPSASGLESFAQLQKQAFKIAPPLRGARQPSGLCFSLFLLRSRQTGRCLIR